MADLDRLTVCRECWHPVEGRGLFCPRCKGDLWFKFPALLLASVRTLAARGWTVMGCEDDEVGPGGKGGLVRVQFAWMAPPIPEKYRRTVPFVAVELPDYRKPCVVSGSNEPGVLGPARMLAEWVGGVPKMAVPFSQTFCDKCKPQGGDWFFGVIKRCPAAGADVRFADGLPDRCAYAVEQVMTRKLRVERLEKLEGWSAVARRILAREGAKS